MASSQQMQGSLARRAGASSLQWRGPFLSPVRWRGSIREAGDKLVVNCLRGGEG